MRFAAAALAVLCLAAPAARAQEIPAETHGGLFFRLQAGLGYLHASADYDGASASAYGTAGFAGLALGGAIGHNLVLYGELWAMSAANPTVQYEFGTGIAENQLLNYAGFGLGLGYFVMPANVFLGVSLDLTRLGVTNSNRVTTNSDVGLALTGTVGKQWWISQHWGLGLSLQLIGGGNKDDNNDSRSTTFRTFGVIGALNLTFG